jgi:hypothetical protein
VSASDVDTATRIASSNSEEPPAGSGAPNTAWAPRPNSARLARQADHDEQHPHHLHDRHAAQIGLELGRERDDLRHRARRRAQKGRGPSQPCTNRR